MMSCRVIRVLQGSEGSEGGLVSRVLDPGLGNMECVDCGAAGPEWAR